VLNLSSSFQYAFQINTDRFTAYDYLADWRQSLPLLPYISIVKQHSGDCFRMLYSTRELGLYKVRIYCDAHLVCDDQKRILRFVPFEGILPVKSQAGIYSLTGHGFFTSETVFESRAHQTWLQYTLQIVSGVPIPGAYRYLPKAGLEDLLHALVQRRLEEIVTRFAERTTQVFN
jgi:hypothetical protein